MDTKISLVEAGALSRLGSLFVEAFGRSPATVVATVATMKVAGFETVRSLEHSDITVSQLILERSASNHNSVARVRMALAQGESIAVVLGSGTLNDVVKRASSELGRPYLVIPTAPSMDGYASPYAWIDGEMIPSKAPVVVLGDPTLLASAPKPMIAAGFSHAIGSAVAQIDWQLSALVNNTVVRSDVMAMMERAQRIYRHGSLLAQGNLRSLSELLEALLARGLAMQVDEDQGGVEGTADLIAAALAENGSFDGPTVAVASVAALHLYGELLRLDVAECYGQPIESWQERVASIASLFGETAGAQWAQEVSRAKFLDERALSERRRSLITLLPTLKREIERLLPPLSQVREALTQVGAPSLVSQIRLTLADLKRSVAVAQMVGSGYTILDLFYELGLFERALSSLEGIV